MTDSNLWTAVGAFAVAVTTGILAPLLQRLVTRAKTTVETTIAQDSAAVAALKDALGELRAENARLHALLIGQDLKIAQLTALVGELEARHRDT